MSEAVINPLEAEVYKPNTYDKVWGKEVWIANNPLYCGKILKLKKGYRCSIHYHIKKDETFYILRGFVLLEAKGYRIVLKQGDAIRITPGVEHRFTGLCLSEILEVSTQHFEDDSVRLSKSEKCTWFKKHLLDKFKRKPRYRQ